MSNDLIKRSDAIEALGEEPYVWTDDDEFARGERSQWIDDVSAIKAVPSVDRPQGEWIENRWKPYFCSICKTEAYFDEDIGEQQLTNYCPNCGSRMRGERNDKS